MNNSNAILRSYDLKLCKFTIYILKLYNKLEVDMKKTIYLICVLTILALTEAIFPQTLWKGAKYGMTINQVKSVFPNAVRLEKPDTLETGEVAILKIGNISIVEELFDAKFFFKLNKLVRVQLALSDPKSFSASMHIFDLLVEALRSKYGAEIFLDIKREAVSYAKATWISGPTNISVHVAGLVYKTASFDKTIFFVINYELKLSENANKL